MLNKINHFIKLNNPDKPDNLDNLDNLNNLNNLNNFNKLNQKWLNSEVFVVTVNIGQKYDDE